MSRTTVYCLCEGYSEKNLVTHLLAPHLGRYGVDIHAPMVTTRRDRKAGKVHKGGGGSFSHYREDLERLIRTHSARPNVHFTSLIDLYALPSDFPGYEEAFAMTCPIRKVERLEQKLTEIVAEFGVHASFIPHFELHEFETLLLSEVAALETLFLDHSSAITKLASEITALGDIEAINHTPTGAPSKRIESHIPVYGKYKRSDQNGAINVLEVIGLDKIRSACKHFDTWVTTLETLG